jgi:hypothetical protein
MKKTNGLIFILAFFMCFNGCEKYPGDEGLLSEKSELTIEEAKAFVDNQNLLLFSLKSGDSQEHKINIRTNWDFAKCINNEKVSVVETLIESMGRFGFATPECFEEWKASGDKAYLYSMSKLVVIKLKKTNQMYSFIMTVAGDKQYVEGKHFDLYGNTYLKRDKNLSGYVLFHNLDGKFVNGWVYCDGQITNTVIEPENLDMQVRLKSALNVLSLNQWYEECEFWITYYIGSDGNIHITEYTESCRDILVFLGYYETGDFEGEPTDGGGGTSGGYTPNNPIDPNLPCSNDPIKNPTIASSGPSGQHGGLFGCVRQGDNDCSEGVYNKFHGGIDISADYGTDIYSMYSGTAKIHYEPGGLGNYIIVSSSINGQSVWIYYGHLSAINISNNQLVNCGTIIGRSGNSGNAGSTTPHVHIQTFVNGTRVSPLQYFYTQFDPNTGSVLNDPCNSL